MNTANQIEINTNTCRLAEITVFITFGKTPDCDQLTVHFSSNFDQFKTSITFADYHTIFIWTELELRMHLRKITL